MRRRAPRTIALAALAVFAACFLLADRYDDQIPAKPQRYVTDRAGAFGPGQAEALNARLEQFERDTSDQILVWVDKKVPEGFTLEDFTVRAGQKWGAGQKKEDNGAILFVFTEDRKVRIEVGYGLEGSLPDATSKQIIDGEMVPRFRENDDPGGIVAGATAMMAAVKGEYKGSGRTVNEGRRRKSDQFGSCLTMAIFFGVFFVLPMIFRRNRFRSHGGGGWWMGGGGFGGGGFGGFGGGGGFSGGGGGFSGGGGSFGGGGASGSW
ncbi:MAG TPA: TPM domain-containing protein [Thermoanaerobaculia bacterium]|nr:TPM domain-containing protein [Thermoanaerobaculia bacterium]